MMRPTILAALFSALLALPAWAADDGKAVKPCTALGTLFGESLCAESLPGGGRNALRTEGFSADEQAALASKFQQDNITALRTAIWTNALARKFGMNALIPTDAEVDSFRVKFMAAMDKSYEADKETAALVRGLLDKNSYSAADEKKLQALLSMTEASARLYEERKKQTDALPEDYRFLTEQSELQIAWTMVALWKEDKLLFDAYGGTMVATGNGPVPVDARKALVAYIRKDGSLSITDTAYEGVLAALDSFAAPDGQIVKPDDPVYKNYFTTPEWQITLGNNSARMKDMKDAIAALPSQPKKK